jgi:hypothetical protein
MPQFVEGETRSRKHLRIKTAAIVLSAEWQTQVLPCHSVSLALPEVLLGRALFYLLRGGAASACPTLSYDHTI